MANYACTNAAYNMHIASYACSNASYNMHIESYACSNAPYNMHIESYACWNVSFNMHIESYACYNEGSAITRTIMIIVLSFDSDGWKSEIPTLPRCVLRAAS